ncbi:hypothetical protein HYH03_016002 [Edaphochlamys debaryana]|uniref:SET domain-containing protein n=1 Tax=Edaphochlamys debaryana TaxID=47281 RepID=A0A836BQJ8_9CHLO|nr:hypothetical protein HYH03_016002 [Edaphochlamys debaryana]|eukprot:KAG2485215.1 hypothetical protein HYH03_016002 [Edaphochlamys debaryana]
MLRGLRQPSAGGPASGRRSTLCYTTRGLRVACKAAGAPAEASAGALYGDAALTHGRHLGPIRLELIPGKGLGWRTTRDVSTGELLLTSLPLAVLYGKSGEAPANEELATALRQAWPRLTHIERRWLLLLSDCCAATRPKPPPTPPPPTAQPAQPQPASADARAAEAPSATSAPSPGPAVSAAAATGSTAEAAAQALLGAAGGGGAGPSHAIAILPPALFGGKAGPGLAPGAAVLELVSRYGYAEAREDPAVTELLDMEPASVLGLWPEAALINHSCAPNASVLPLGGALYVRAGRALQEGEEVTVSYLAAGLFSPVAQRRSLLRASHGFLCACPRCRMEQAHFPTRRYPELDTPAQPQPSRAPQPRHQPQPQSQQGGAEGQQAGERSSAEASTSGDAAAAAAAAVDDALLAAALLGRRGQGPLQRLLDAVFGAGRFTTAAAPDNKLLAEVDAAVASDLGAAVQAVLTASSRPRQQQAALLERMDGMLARVETSASFLELPPRGRLLVLGSVYGLVRLTAELAELSGQAGPERRLALLSLQASVLEAVAPGSDAHVMAAVKAAGVARRVHSAEGPEARRAELAAGLAHVARYGRGLLTGDGPAVLRRMQDIRRRLLTGSGLASAMGVMAWDEQYGRKL